MYTIITFIKHGVLRQSSTNQRTEAQRQAELKAIDEYQTLDKLVLEKVLIAKLLSPLRETKLIPVIEREA